MIINIDVDGIIRNFVQSSIDVYTKYLDSNCKITHDDINQYDFKNKLPKIAEIGMGNFFNKYAIELYVDAKPYDNEINHMLELYNRGHTINIVTKQPRGLEVYTIDWLHKNNVPYHNLMFTQNKNLIKGDCLVDDCIDNLKSITTGTPICLERPWNKEWKGYKIKSLKELV